jgi:oxygen-independent coproporphyrinogen-3 oxidase
VRHVYVHVPFCRRRCSYCDFAIAVRREIPADRYVRAVLREHDVRRAREPWDDAPLETLYLGGGTPSLLPPARLAEVARRLVGAEGVASSGDVEITLEANPDDVTAVSAAAWVEAGVNRVSLGVQSFDAAVLEWMHRTHQAGASREAVRLLRQAGVASVSLDLIFALPQALQPDLRSELEQALELEPEHLSLYGLTVEARTPLARWISRGATVAAGDERYAEEFLLADAQLTAAGLEHYEVSNYARAGQRSRHNSAYWTGRPYVGLGPSAHSFRAGERAWNVRHWAAYEHAVEQDGSAVAERERLDEQQRRLEQLYLGLRTSEGVAADSLDPSAAPELEAAAGEGWLLTGGGKIRLTPRGWLKLDAVTTRLTTSAQGG